MTGRLFAFLFVLIVCCASLAVRSKIWGQRTTMASTLPTPVPRGGGVVIDERRRQLIGVRTTRVARGSLEGALRAVGTVGYAESRLLDVNLKVDGWVTDLFIDSEGQSVERGQPLFRVYSPELLAAQNELIAALRNRDLIVVSKAENAREFSERVLDIPKLALTRLDVSADQIRALEETRQIPPSVVFRSTANGIVIEKSVVQGMHVERGRTLFRIADLSQVWVDFSLPESDAALLRPGASATVSFRALPGEQFRGKIDHIYAQVVELNRKIGARIVLGNRDGRLRRGMYGDVEVATPPVEGLLVPSDAVVDSGKRQVVFVDQGAGHFEPRNVATGRSAGGRVVVLDGLQENESVASRATFFIDSESKMEAALQNYNGALSGSTQSVGPLGFRLSLVINPNPPRSGENTVEAQVLNPAGQPVEGAEVHVMLSMPAMPTMNMPPMQSEARLIHVGSGAYRGRATITMPGRWDVSLRVFLQGNLVATSQTTLFAQ